jgi:hypothetical protein
VFRAFNQPITSLTDALLTLRDDSRQKDFVAQHSSELERMTRALARAGVHTSKLADFLSDTPAPDGDRAWKTMLQKQTLGDQLLSDIEWARDAAKDPAEKARLDGLALEAEWWMECTRDQTVAQEIGDVRHLEQSLSKLRTQSMKQRTVLAQAADQLHALAMASPQGVSGSVSSYVHTQPAVVPFVAGIQKLLLGAKASVDAAVTGGSR